MSYVCLILSYQFRFILLRPAPAHVFTGWSCSHPLPHKLKTGPCIFLVCQFNNHAYQELCNCAWSSFTTSFLVRNVRIFHLLIHQLFSHLSAAIMNITMIPLFHSFHIIVTSQPADRLTQVCVYLGLCGCSQCEEMFIRMIHFAETEFT